MLFAPKQTEFYFPNILLESARIELRPPRMEDWPAWAEVRARNYDYLKPFEPAWAAHCLTEKFFERRLKRQAEDWAADRGQYFLIILKDFKNAPHDVIGGINLNNICRGVAHFASLGYWVDECVQGQGYMGEALEAVKRYAFEDAGLHRLHGACVPENIRSQKALLRAGFMEEGYAENYLQIDGKWQDHILYGLTIERWEKV